MQARMARVVRLLLFAVIAGSGLLGLVAAPFAASVQAQTATVAPGAVSVVRARGVVNPTLAHFIGRSIDQAEQRPAPRPS